MARIFDVDPQAGIKRLFHWDETTDSFVIETVQDVSDLTETNKALYAMVDARANWRGDMHRVASIPLNVYYDLVEKGIAQDERAFRRWLDDPDNQVFRTRPGKLSR